MTVKRNLGAFWLLGLCNNFAYVIMLSAAKDILEKGTEQPDSKVCNETIVHRDCSQMSTGSVLLADIIPSLLIKTAAPVLLQNVPFDIRHAAGVVLQASAFVVVAISDTAYLALAGVVLASFGSGLGEVSYLSLSAYFPDSVITAYSSGTGGAGVFGALAYASLTDAAMANLTPKQALLTMLVVPFIFAYAFWWVLHLPPSVHRVRVVEPRSWLIARGEASTVAPLLHDSDDEIEEEEGRAGRDAATVPFNFQALPSKEKWRAIKPLFSYMLPLALVYFAEYFINQGLLELLVFDCAHGFRLAPAAQYRWFQVLYQIGVFVSRTVGGILPWMPAVSILAGLQLLNSGFLTAAAVKTSLLPHFAAGASIVLYEGLLGGSAYVHTFRTMHKEISPSRREFALGVVSIADTFGILLAGMAAINAHNAICSLPL
ncbi:cln-3.2 [Pristionchus pacificus]|uniref:Battenin n=1 Tax=Pristionchus pacificus TaxID=54126 RepID=A0A2A6BUX4_PRIPA|nr:cln-3.2 [Pristionchus pacificus]|eukprot:PDM69720.1 cln-3.2 [Pristionchus pacificus]